MYVQREGWYMKWDHRPRTPCFHPSKTTDHIALVWVHLPPCQGYLQSPLAIYSFHMQWWFQELGQCSLRLDRQIRFGYTNGRGLKRSRIGLQYKLKLFRWTAEIGTNKLENSRHVDELARWSLDKKINDAFSGPWLFHVRHDGIIGTDFRKAILQKHPNISSGIKRFVKDDSPSDCKERFLAKTVTGMRFGATPD